MLFHYTCKVFQCRSLYTWKKKRPFVHADKVQLEQNSSEVATLLKLVCMVLALLLTPPALAQTTDISGKGDLYGTYAFAKQLYMNPLSSFMAFDGFTEYYELTAHTFAIIDAAGQRRAIDITWQEEPVDEKSYESSFIMEGFGIPDISSYKTKRQFTLLSERQDGTQYRIYLMDGDVWLAKIHQDTANVQKQEYIWSLYKVEKSAMLQSVSGTQEGVDDFLALLGSSKPQSYENDTCYNITSKNVALNTGYTVFKFDHSCASYLLYENEIYSLGEWFGGPGVVSMAAADLNEDGLSELYFTYSFGSGLHRANADYFDPALRRVLPLSPAMLNKDMVVVQNKTGGLALYEAAFPFTKNFVQYTALGTKHITDIKYLNGEIRLDPLPQGD